MMVMISEKYFDMNKKHAREALDIYKKFLIRMDKVAEFLKVAEVNNSYQIKLVHLIIIFNDNFFP